LVELLNAWKDGKYESTSDFSCSKVHGSTGQFNCMDCHGNDVPRRAVHAETIMMNVEKMK
jgi:hypothetical protein